MHRVILLLCILLLISCKTETKTETLVEHVTQSVSYSKVEKLPESVIYDTDLEINLIQIFNAHQKEFVVSEVIITSDRWFSTFNAMGHVIARSRSASVIANHKGICYLQDLVFEQKGNGTVFEDIKILKKGGWNTFNCKLIKNKTLAE